MANLAGSLVKATSVTVRPESPDDERAIDEVMTAAFASAEHASGTEADIVRALRRAGVLTVSLVAEVDGAVRGHVAVSPVRIADGTAAWFGLGPVSVEPGRQRQGLGSRLVRAALAVLEAEGAAGCVVLGDPDYYSRFGFRPASQLVFPGVPAEYFQALPLRGVLPNGVVAYHEAFQVVGTEGA